MKRDYPIIMGVVLFGAVVFVSMNLVVDLSYHIIDPRVRLKK
jgi:peptide/nickel transport system permease protein